MSGSLALLRWRSCCSGSSSSVSLRGMRPLDTFESEGMSVMSKLSFFFLSVVGPMLDFADRAPIEFVKRGVLLLLKDGRIVEAYADECFGEGKSSKEVSKASSSVLLASLGVGPS